MSSEQNANNKQVKRIKFVGYWDNFDYRNQLFYNILSKHFEVRIVDDPDYIICNIFGNPYEYCKYPQVRIMNVSENYIPDFNLIDYAICSYPIQYDDRAFYKPAFVDTSASFGKIETSPKLHNKAFLEKKEYFANFIAGHESEYGIRGDFFKKLSSYRRIESVGTYLNNTGKTVSFKDSSKIEFQRKCKFTLCFESTSHNGFVTEKLVDAFFAETVPVYYGSPSVNEIFNCNAFINCSDFDSFDDVIKRVIEIDQNDDLYLDMINQPVFVDENYKSNILNQLEKYILYIFNQPIETAFRRSRVYHSKNYNDYLSKAVLPEQLSKRELIRLFKKKLIHR